MAKRFVLISPEGVNGGSFVCTYIDPSKDSLSCSANRRDWDRKSEWLSCRQQHSAVTDDRPERCIEMIMLIT